MTKHGHLWKSPWTGHKFLTVYKPQHAVVVTFCFCSLKWLNWRVLVVLWLWPIRQKMRGSVLSSLALRLLFFSKTKQFNKKNQLCTWVTTDKYIKYQVNSKSKLSHSFLCNWVLNGNRYSYVHSPFFIPAASDGVFGLLLRKYTASVSCSVPAWQGAKPWTGSMVYSRKYLLPHKVATKEKH